MLAQRGVHVGEDHALGLELLVDLVVDDLGLVLGADAGEELALGLGDAEPVEGVLDVLGDLAPVAAVALLGGADEVVDVVPVDLAEVAAPGAGSGGSRSARAPSGGSRASTAARPCTRRSTRRPRGRAPSAPCRRSPSRGRGSRSSPCSRSRSPSGRPRRRSAASRIRARLGRCHGDRQTSRLISSSSSRTAKVSTGWKAGRVFGPPGGQVEQRAVAGALDCTGGRVELPLGERAVVVRAAVLDREQARRRRSGRRRSCARPTRPGASRPPASSSALQTVRVSLIRLFLVRGRILAIGRGAARALQGGRSVTERHGLDRYVAGIPTCFDGPNACSHPDGASRPSGGT